MSTPEVEEVMRLVYRYGDTRCNVGCDGDTEAVRTFGEALDALRSRITALVASKAELVGALRPFANSACPPASGLCGCHNCLARLALANATAGAGQQEEVPAGESKRELTADEAACLQRAIRASGKRVPAMGASAQVREEEVAARLRKLATGRLEYRVQHPVDRSYCVSFSREDGFDPERAAREWLAHFQRNHPDHRHAKYEVAEVRSFSELERAALEAADLLAAAPSSQPEPLEDGK